MQVAAGYVLHIGRMQDSQALSVGDSVTAEVDYQRRNKIVPNHTFTHVLNWALREELGDGVSICCLHGALQNILLFLRRTVQNHRLVRVSIHCLHRCREDSIVC